MPAFDAAAARRWRSAGVPGWVPRGVLVAGWVGAFAAAAAFDDRPCSAVDPTVCGPDVGWAVVGGTVLLATPVLLVLMPALGCLAGVLFGLVTLADPVLAARAGFGLHGLACAAVFAWLVTARRRQARLAAAVAAPVAVPGPPPRPTRAGFVAAVLLAAAGAASLLLWHTWTVADDRHVAAAARLDATVVAELDDGWTVRLRLPDRSDEVEVEVEVEVIDSYPVGSVVPVLVDRTTADPWVALLAEPSDNTLPLSAGLAAGLIALAMAGWEGTRRQVPARMLPVAPGVLARGIRREDEVELWDADGTVPFARVRVRWPSDSDWEPELDPEDLDPEEWDDLARSGDQGPDEVEDGGTRAVTVLGDLREGGWVALVAGADVLWPRSTLRPLGQAERLDLIDVVGPWPDP